MNQNFDRIGLTPQGCRNRQQLLRAHLADNQLNAALICDRRYVHYLTGYWCPAVFAAVVLIERGGPVTLITPHPVEQELAADTIAHYPAQKLATLIDDQLGAALALVANQLQQHRRIGIDGLIPHGVHPAAAWHDLRPALFPMRRRKHPDEIALLSRAIAATEAAYTYAFEHLKPGITEVELFAGMQAAAAEFAGEVLGEFGNDFQIGSPGGPPRRKRAEPGEIAVFDLSITLRGYRSDMCRSFAVDRNPTPAQAEARERIMAVLHHVEQHVKPGASCHELYDEAARMLTANSHGWAFPHHLGHGIGLAAHESPRLNPHWNDTFAIGDVFTAEPGLYAPELRAGLRIEEIYHLTESGLTKLSAFSTELA